MTDAVKDNNRISSTLAVSSVDGLTPVTLYANPSTHALLVAGTLSIDTTGLATSDNQTNASQKTQIVDGSGNIIASTSNALNVKFTNTTLAVTGTFYQTTQPVSLASSQVASGAFASGSISDGADVTLGAKADNKSTSTDTTAITVMSVLKEISYMEQNPASRAVTFTGSTDVATQTTLSAINTKLVSGTDIGDVTINNSTGGSAVNIQDGGNTITVDGAVTTSGTVTEASAADIKTSVQLIDDIVYTTGDALVKTAGLAAQFDDVSPGTVTENKMAPLRMSTLRGLYTTIRDAAGNERGMNVDANGAIAVTATNGTAANLKVAATLDAETTKVLGVVRVADGSGNLLSSSTNALDINIKSGSIANTTFAATQGTASNLKTEAHLYDSSTNGIGSTSNALDVNIKSGTVTTHPVTVASGGIASGAIASGAVASGAIASGALAAGSIAVGAITAGDTSIATTEDTARAAGEHLVKIGIARLDTPVANANVGTDGDYTSFIADNFGKQWVAGAVPEDTAHISGEALSIGGSRRIGTLATSSGSDGDWSTVNQTAEGAAWTTLAPTTTSGLSIGNFTSGDSFTALTNSSQVVKGSAGLFYGYYIYNPNAAATYVMIYNVASASVTVGTTNPSLVFCIPATSAANLALPYGITFDTAMAIAAATTGGGNTAPTTALEAMIWYK